MKQSNFSVRQGRSRSYDALPLQRSDMPMDYLVSLAVTLLITLFEYLKILVHQSLQGFDPTYRNIIDYIVRITYRIWETNDRELSTSVNAIHQTAKFSMTTDFNLVTKRSLLIPPYNSSLP